MWLVLLAFHLVGLVGFNLILRQSVLKKIDRFGLATIAQTGIAVPAFLLLFIYPPHFAKYSGSSYLFLASVVLLTIALQVSNVKALQYLEASVFAVLYNLRIILTTILGILFLNEKFVWLRIAGGFRGCCFKFPKPLREEADNTCRLFQLFPNRNRSHGNYNVGLAATKK
jgi:drug/metabolite transporter (DMT)-like permease